MLAIFDSVWIPSCHYNTTSIDCDDLISIYKINTGNCTFREKMVTEWHFFLDTYTLWIYTVLGSEVYKDSCHCKPYCAAELKNLCFITHWSDDSIFI